MACPSTTHSAVPRVGVHRERDRRVSEHLLDDLRLLAVNEPYSEFPSHPQSSRQTTRVFWGPT